MLRRGGVEGEIVPVVLVTCECSPERDSELESCVALLLVDCSLMRASLMVVLSEKVDSSVEVGDTDFSMMTNGGLYARSFKTCAVATRCTSSSRR